MDKWRQELTENLEKYLINLDEEFSFKCRGCGKCCKNREDIMLSSRDLFNIAKKLELSPAEIVDKYCQAYIGDSSRVPIVRLMPQGVNRICPLLKGERCRVHDVKPSVCALFPLGRVTMGEEIDKGLELGKPIKIGYILQPADCGSLKQKHTVRSWMERFNIPIEDQFYHEWNKTLLFLSDFIRGVEDKKVLNRVVINRLWDAIFIKFYLEYDCSKEFLPQFKHNVSALRELTDALKS